MEVSIRFSFFSEEIKIWSTSCKIFTFSAVISPRILIASPGPGKGCLESKVLSIFNALSAVSIASSKRLDSKKILDKKLYV